MVVLNPELMRAGSKKQMIASHTGNKTTWADVHGKVLHFSSNRMPSRRACGIHAALALQHAREEHWLEAASSNNLVSDEDMCVDSAAWASPSFDRTRIKAFLEEAAATAIPAIPGKKCIFIEQTPYTRMQLSAIFPSLQ